MVLINVLLSFYITAVAVAIMMRISALQVPSLDNVSPYMKFDTYSSIRDNVGTDIVYVVHNAIGPFCVDYHDVLQPGFCQVLRFVVAAESDLCRLQNGGCIRANHQLKWQCAVLVEGLMYDPINVTFNRTGESKHSYLTPTG